MAYEIAPLKSYVRFYLAILSQLERVWQSLIATEHAIRDELGPFAPDLAPVPLAAIATLTDPVRELPGDVAALWRPEDPEATRFPAGIPFIVGNEGAERFSYYGMRAILYTYLAALYVQFAAEATLTQAQTDAAKAKATAVAHLFMAGVYAFPMAGAILADRLLGKFPAQAFPSTR